MSLNGRDFIRYSRHLLMADVGEEGQEKLLQGRVLIVGLGGLGCPVALYLAAAGVGHLTLCDPDVVELTNLQRQILYKEADCGQPKVLCAQAALAALNPGIELVPRQQTADDSLWQGTCYDLVVDCTDNLAARHFLNRQCRNRKIPLVSASAMGWEGQFATFDFSRQQEGCFACAIPENSPEPTATCANSGVIGPVLGTMGSMQAIAAIKALLGQPISHGQMQRFDGKRGTWLTLTIRPNPTCGVCGLNATRNLP